MPAGELLDGDASLRAFNPAVKIRGERRGVYLFTRPNGGGFRAGHGLRVSNLPGKGWRRQVVRISLNGVQLGAE